MNIQISGYQVTGSFIIRRLSDTEAAFIAVAIIPHLSKETYWSAIMPIITVEGFAAKVTSTVPSLIILSA